jgi:sporulation protein YlmC with PRC-barrel domain
MNIKPIYLTVSLLAAGLLSAPSARADHEKELRTGKSQCSASEIIGQKVKNQQDEDLGKVQDLIVNHDSGTVPYAVIAHGGLFGAGRTKTAVPLESLKPSADGKFFVLNATKEQLQAAPRTASGEWASANAEWTRGVDGFYGTPVIERSRYDRDRREASVTTTTTTPADRTAPGDRTFVRDPAPKGAEVLASPADTALCEKICESTDLVHVKVQNGITHIYGTVDNDDARKNLETKIRAVPGVNRVESHIKVRNP